MGFKASLGSKESSENSGIDGIYGMSYCLELN